MATDFVAGVIRNGGSPGYWDVLSDEYHVPLNISTVSLDGNLIRVDYGVTFAFVITLIVGADESLAAQGVTAGASVSKDHCSIGLRRAGGLVDPRLIGLGGFENLWIFGLFETA